MVVSILARPEGRALPFWRCSRRTPGAVSILARPEGRALPYRRLGIPAQLVFQSSPVPKDGRYNALRLNTIGSACFNPRPSRRTGATSTGDLQDYAVIVSILARPEGRALQE